MLTLNTNIMSLTTQNYLNITGSTMGVAAERLASGKRINSSKDDAAGLAISDRMTTQINGSVQASRNSNDAISLAQTTEGALKEVTNNLQRIRMLTVQAANGIYAVTDRRAIQQEVSQRLEAIDTISSQTQFNGIKVLAKNTSMNFQTGANDGDIIAVAMKMLNVNTLGLESYDVSKVLATKIDLNNAQIQGSYTLVAGTDFIDTAAAPGTATELRVDTVGKFYVFGKSAADGAKDSLYTATVDNNTGKVSWDSTSKIATSVGKAAKQDTIGVNNSAGTPIVGVAGNTLFTYVSTDGKVSYALRDDTTGTFKDAVLKTTIVAGPPQVNTVTATLGTVNLTTPYLIDPLSMIDSALVEVTSLRSILGAVQNRFESNIRTQDTGVVNLSAARERIEATDYALETANYTQASILQQAGIAVLAQVNSQPKNILPLLQQLG